MHIIATVYNPVENVEMTIYNIICIGLPVRGVITQKDIRPTPTQKVGGIFIFYDGERL